MPLMIGGAMMAGGQGLNALGSMFGSSGAKKQAKLMQEALDYQKNIDKRNFDYQKGIDTRSYSDLSPYRRFGSDQVNQLSDFMKNKNPADFMDPGYKFRLNTGTNAIMNNAASRGMAQSGDTLRALDQFGQDMGSQEYNNAFNRWMGEGQMRQGMAGVGQNAAVQGGSLANQGASTITHGGNQAAGNIGMISANTNVGAPDQVWGNFFSGLGGQAAGAGMSGMGGTNGMMNSLKNLFANKTTPQTQNTYGFTGML